MNPATESIAPKPVPLSRIAHFPIAFFGATLGFAGLSLAYENAHLILGFNAWVATTLTFLTVAVFVLFLISYAVKWIKFPQMVKQDLNHPVALNFFAAGTLSLMLISILLNPLAPAFAAALFYIGATVQLLFTVYIMNVWMLYRQWKIEQMNPAWFIPIVANIVAPIGAMLFVSSEVAWFFFSIGLVFWLMLLALVLYRLFFFEPLPKLLEPTLFILIAPPAMGFLSYMALTGNDQVDDFARILYYIALFFTLMLLTQIKRFLTVPFSLSWWAYTFPLSAIASASLVMYDKLQNNLFGFFAALFLSILSALVLHATLRTLMAVRKGKICVAAPVPPKAPAAEDNQTEQSD